MVSKEQQTPEPASSSVQSRDSQGMNARWSLSDVLLPYFQRLWGVRRELLYTNIGVLLLTLITLLFVIKPYYDSTITILPSYQSTSSMIGGLGSLAAMAGVSLGPNADPSDIYQNLLASESVVEPVLSSRYKTGKYADSVTLYQYFGIDVDNGLPENERQRKVFVDALNIYMKSVLNVSKDQISDILTVRVRMAEPQLSADVVNRLVASLDEYVRTQMRSNAKIRRLYIEKRVGEVKDSMVVAEDRLVKFQQVNRVISQSPELAIEQSRLSMQAQILESVYTNLSNQLELAKIDEIKDSPIVNVREWARDPVVKAGPPRLILLILICVISMLFTSMYFLSRDRLRLFLSQIRITRTKTRDV